MFDNSKPQLRLVADNSADIAPLVDRVARYTAEINERRRQLGEELVYFETKLHDLAELDPQDFTGLGKVYGEHAQHIRRLLQEFDRKAV
jgi:hypothetical protein